MNFDFNLSFGKPNVAKDSLGNWFYSLMDSFNSDGSFKNERERLKIIVSNPAILKVLTFSADVATMAQVNQYSEDGETIIKKNYLESVAKPNPWQTWKQLSWDIDFWLNIGNAYVYEDGGTIYVLNPLGMQLSREQEKNFEQLSFSKYGKESSYNAKKGKFKYYHNINSSSYQRLDLKNVHVLSDLSNSITGTWFKSNSRIDALYQVISNSQASLKSKGVNIGYSKKFLVSGQADSLDTSYRGVQMNENEKSSIENAIQSDKQIFATKSKIALDHMVSNLEIGRASCRERV